MRSLGWGKNKVEYYNFEVPTNVEDGVALFLGFPNFVIIDTLVGGGNGGSGGRGAVLSIVGPLAASLASTCYMSVAWSLPPKLWKPKMFLDIAKSSSKNHCFRQKYIGIHINDLKTKPFGKLIN